MLTDYDVIQAVDDLYNNAPVFDHIINGDATFGVYVGIKHFGDDTLVVYRGSTVRDDWAKDFFAVPHENLLHPQLGVLHAGFALGADKTVELLKPLIRGRLIVGGHSLGAAQALIGAATLMLQGITPTAAVVFGEPKPGFPTLAEFLAPLTIRSYRNCDDIVTHVPFSIMMLNFVHPRELLDVHEPPPTGDAWGKLGSHHSWLYNSAIKKLQIQPVIIP